MTNNKNMNQRLEAILKRTPVKTLHTDSYNPTVIVNLDTGRVVVENPELTHLVLKDKGPTRREFFPVLATILATAAGLGATACATPQVDTRSSTIPVEHFRLYGIPSWYGAEAEKVLGELTGFLGVPYYGVIEIWGGGSRPYTTRGIPPRIDMPTDRIYGGDDILFHELVRAIMPAISPLLNRGFAVVSQRVLRPHRKTFPLDGDDVHLAVSYYGSPSNVGDVDKNQYVIDASFVGHLIDKYGIEKLVDLSSMAFLQQGAFVPFPRRELIVYGKLFPDLVNEWREKVQKNRNRKPLDIQITQRRKQYDEKMIQRYGGRVVVNGNRNISNSGLGLVRKDASEAYAFLTNFFGFDLSKGTITIDLSYIGPPASTWNGDGRIYIKPVVRTALNGNYPLILSMAYPFIGKDENLAARVAAFYLQSLHPTLGGLKVRAYPNYGADVDRIVKANMEDLIPLDNLSFTGKDPWRESILPGVQVASFGRWVVNTYAKGDRKKGVDMLIQVARGASYESVFGASLETMKQGWMRHIKTNINL